MKGVCVCERGWVTLASFSWLSMLLTSLVSRRDFVSEEDKLADRDSISHWKERRERNELVRRNNHKQTFRRCSS